MRFFLCCSAFFVQKRPFLLSIELPLWPFSFTTFMPIPPFRRALAAFRVLSGISYRTIAVKCGMSIGSVALIKKKLSQPPPARQTATNRPGRPRKLGDRGRRILLRAVGKMRNLTVNFSVRQLAKECDLLSSVSLSTLYREMKRGGLQWGSLRRKGILSVQDRKRRLVWCHKHKHLPASFWEEVGLYLDCVSFVHKTRPQEAGCVTRSKAWLKKAEKLSVTASGHHEFESKSKVLRLVVAVSHRMGLVVCEPYESMSGAFFAKFCRRVLPAALQHAAKPWTILQDNDPSQSSAVALRALQRINVSRHVWFFPMLFDIKVCLHPLLVQTQRT